MIDDKASREEFVVFSLKANSPRRGSAHK